MGTCSCVYSLFMKECSSLLATSTGCKTFDKWSMFIYTAVKHLFSRYLSFCLARMVANEELITPCSLHLSEDTAMSL